MRVLRVYHAGRDAQHRGRERALAAAGVDLTLAVPSAWPDAAAEVTLREEPFTVLELPARRPGDVNRHSYREDVAHLLRDAAPDVLDVHEEPVSLAARQWLAAAPAGLPVVLYTAQNVDKRYPPPYAQYERRALARADGLYPCSRQAASVARGKGFAGAVEVLPLGVDDEVFTPGSQRVDDDELVLGFAGRFVPEKGLLDAVAVRDALARVRPTRLLAIGDGPEAVHVRGRGGVDLVGWQGAEELAEAYRRMHVLLVPSTATPSWAEQFGRVVVEAQASGAVVAAYASGALPEVVGGAGVLAAEGDASGLARALARLMEHPDEYEEKRSAGLALSAQRTWARVAERQALLYERVQSPFPRTATGRRAARAEFGPTAQTPAGMRPVALLSSWRRAAARTARAAGRRFARA